MADDSILQSSPASFPTVFLEKVEEIANGDYMIIGDLSSNLKCKQVVKNPDYDHLTIFLTAGNAFWTVKDSFQAILSLKGF